MDRSPCRGKKALRGGETRRAAALKDALADTIARTPAGEWSVVPQPRCKRELARWDDPATVLDLNCADRDTVRRPLLTAAHDGRS
jgi:hypothetical protein